AKSSGAGTADSGGFALESIDEIALVDADVSVQQIPSRGAQPFVVVAAHKINVEMGNILLDAQAINQWTANANLSGVSVDVGALATPVVFKSGSVKLENNVLDA